MAAMAQEWSHISRNAEVGLLAKMVTNLWTVTVQP